MTTDDPEIGDFVLATKHDDGDPGDAWATGYYLGSIPKGSGHRYLVGGVDGKSYRANGYRRIRAGLRIDVAEWLQANAKALEASPPGTVNLWDMLTDSAWEESGEDAP